MKRREFLKIASLSIVSGFFMPRVLLPSAEERKKRWAMVVDISICAKNRDCRTCIDACHEVHNIPYINDPKEEIKWIWTSTFGKVFENDVYVFSAQNLGSYPVLLMCNHCENPPCVKVCPTKATWKRRDGIVMMDYHRCIGCRYCMAACPYGARSFNWKDNRGLIRKINYDFPIRSKGVVEKCNFCEERISKGLIPKCAEVCKYGALKFGDLSDPDSSVSKTLRERFSIVRKSHLGTGPNVFYVL